MFKKYYDAGLSVIPLARDAKYPTTLEWSKQCDQRAPENQIEAWDRLYDLEQVGIGVCLGYNDLIAIDYDSPELSLREILPPSPVRKTGKPDRLCAFYRGKVQARKVPGVVEVLARGNQTVLPSASLHPETKLPYVWITPDTLLDFRVEDLPEITEADIAKLVKAATPMVQTSLEGGRNNKLLSIVAAMIDAGKDTHEILEEVIEYDEKHHSPPLFTDVTEGFDKDVRTNAFRFVASVSSSISKKVNFKYIAPVSSDSPQVPETDPTSKKSPEPRGELMKFIVDEILTRAPLPQKSFALAGALSTLSVLACGRYHFKGVNPVIYSMILANSSEGKDAPKSIIQEILGSPALRPYNLLGASWYSSAPAFVAGFQEQRVRLDVMEEMSSFFAAVKNPNSMVKQIATLRTEFWSYKVDSYFGGLTAIGRKENYACAAPMAPFLGLCQPGTFKKNASHELMELGFIPRMLFFTKEEDVEFSRHFMDARSNSAAIGEILAKTMFSQRSVLVDGPRFDYGGGEKQINAKAMKCSPEVTEALYQIASSINKRIQKLQTDDSGKSIWGKAGENVTRVAMLAALSSQRTTITLEDVEWAKELVFTSIENSELIQSEISSDNPVTKFCEALEYYLRDRATVSKKSIHMRFRKCPLAVRDQGIKDLESRGVLERTTAPGQTAYLVKIHQ